MKKLHSFTLISFALGIGLLSTGCDTARDLPDVAHMADVRVVETDSSKVSGKASLEFLASGKLIEKISFGLNEGDSSWVGLQFISDDRFGMYFHTKSQAGQTKSLRVYGEAKVNRSGGQQNKVTLHKGRNYIMGYGDTWELVLHVY